MPRILTLILLLTITISTFWISLLNAFYITTIAALVSFILLLMSVGYRRLFCHRVLNSSEIKIESDSFSCTKINDDSDSIPNVLGLLQKYSEPLVIFKRGKVIYTSDSAPSFLGLLSLSLMKQLRFDNPILYEVLTSYKSSSFNVIDIKTSHGIRKCLVKVIKPSGSNNDDIVVVSFVDIDRILDDNQFDSWQKLVNVLTHELMNSIGPITSLTATASSLMKDDLSLTRLVELRKALTIVERRSEGLMRFVEKYRDVASPPKIYLSNIKVNEIALQVSSFYQASGHCSNRIIFEVDSSVKRFKITTDLHLIEQVIINIINNAIHSIEKRYDGIVSVKISRDVSGCIFLSVKDNGVGISSESIDKIFLPFFTTKSKGSGIGLFLSKQICLALNVELKVNSTLGEGTEFKLNFPNH